MSQPFPSKNEKNDKRDERASVIVELMLLLSSVNMETPDAELNAISISDDKGGRVFL